MSEPVYVGFWWRFAAFLVDTIAIGIVLIPLGILFFGMPEFPADVVAAASDPNYQPPPINTGRWALNNILPAIVIVAFWLLKSATPGKMLINAVIVDAKTGQQPSTGQFIIRYIGYFVAAIPLFLGLIWVGFDSRKQGWHDKLAGTVVVFKPKN